MTPLRKKKYNSGKVRNATPLTVDGLNFKSKLEAYCYMRLKEEGLSAEYEMYKFKLIEDFEFNNDSYELTNTNKTKEFKKANNKIRALTYTPDFVNKKDKWIIECKGYPNEAFPIKWKLFKFYLAMKHITATLYVPRNHAQVDEVINLIKSKNGTR